MASRVVPRFKKPVARQRIFLKEWRKYRGLTQQALADRVGMSKGNISQLEANVQGYSPEGLQKLAEALRCEPGQLISVDPTKDGAIWSIWEKAQPAEREKIEEYAKFITKTGT